MSPGAGERPTATGRARIAMSSHEVSAFLTDARTLILSTNGPTGVPHVVPLWFALDADELVTWSYVKSQKVRNIMRDPRVGCLVEDGTAYRSLRGVTLEGRAAVISEPDAIRPIWEAVFRKYNRGDVTPEGIAGFERQVAKRVALRIVITHVASWDHAKFG